MLSRLAARLKVTAAIVALLGNNLAWAQQLPTGGSVAAGSATIAQPNSSTLNINQSTNQAIINWNTFSVGRGGTVNFNQPNSSSATLNRVTGSTPSWIAGTINAPGTVLLVNPNGIAITKSGVINTGSFAASTLDISNADFMAGNYKFSGNGGSAAVRNAGRINVSDGGFAALLGGQVSNSGVISARLGKVGLGAGELITLDLAGDGFLSVAVPSSQVGKLVDASGALVTNSGKIRANGGQVFLSAATASNILRDAVNVPGSIRANSVGTHNGKIVIGGGAGGKVTVTGKLAASGGKKNAGGKVAISGAQVNLAGKVNVSGKTGGTVTAQADQKLLMTGEVAAKGRDGKGGAITATSADIELAGATLDASGTAGGGTILIGGDYQGGGTLAHALVNTIDATSVIRADATVSGDGGKIVVWSDQYTGFAGTISAKGGAASGNGGNAEVSGKETLVYAGLADLRAVHGNFGTLLLDPYSVTISNSADFNQSGFTATGNDSVINVTTLQDQLALSNVTVSTGSGGSQAGDITVANAVTWSTGSTLTLSAAGGIAINAAVTGASGALTLSAGGSISQSAAGVITVDTLSLAAGGGATLNTATNAISNLGAVSLGGALNLLNTGDLTIVGAVSAAGITLNNNGALAINNTLNAGGGFNVLSLMTTGDGNGITQNSGTINAVYLTISTENGNVTLTNAGNGFTNLNAISLGSGQLNLVNGNPNTSLNGAIAAYGGVSIQSYWDVGLWLGGSIDAGSANVSLTSQTGGIYSLYSNLINGGAVTLSAARAISLNNLYGDSLSVTAGTTVNLNTAVFSVSGSSGGSFTLTNLARHGAPIGTLTVNGITAGGRIYIGETIGPMIVSGAINSNGRDIELAVAQSLTINAPVTAAGATLALEGAGAGSISQGSGGILTATNLLATTGYASITLLADNVVNGKVLFQNFDSVSFKSTSGFTVGGFSTITNYLQTETWYPGIRTSGAGSTTLIAGGAITQASGTDDIIMTGTLNLTTLGNANATLNNANNLIANLGTVSLGAGALSLAGTAGLVGTDWNTQVQTTGLTVTGLVTAQGGVTLTNTGTVTQSASGGVVTSQLLVNAGGSVDLTAGAANNNVTTIAGLSGGDFLYADSLSTGLTIGTVGSTSGIVSTNGGIAVSAWNAGATLYAVGAVTASNGDVTLQARGYVNIGDGTNPVTITASSATGVITLASTGGSVIENNGGALSGAKLSASAAGDVILTGTNTIGTALTAGRFAANAGGVVTFYNNGSITVDKVDTAIGGTLSVNGITAVADIVLKTTATGNITQTSNATITSSGGGLALQALNGSITLDQANVISGNFAVIGSSSTDVTLRNTGTLRIGSVQGAGTGGPYSGVEISGTLSLASNGGNILQTARIIAGTIQGSTTGGGNMTLSNVSNSFLNLGTTSLGAGRLQLFSGASSLTVTGAVAATGGVTLQTLTALNINNTINAGSGTVALSQVFATNGFITQNASGIITANSLSASAVGQVTLGAWNNVARVSGSASNGQFVFFNDRGAGNTLSVTGITSTGGRAWVVENLGNMLVGTVNSNGQNIILQAGGTLSLSGAITATGAGVALQGDAGIAQNSLGIITATNLLGLSSAGDIVLTQNNVVGGNVGFTATNGSVSFTSASGFTVGGVSTVDAFSVANAGIRTSLAGSTTLTAGGDVTQAFGAINTQIISTGTLNLTTSGNASVTLSANNAITYLGAVSLGTGSLDLRDAGGLTVTGAVNAGSVQVISSGTIVIDNTITAAGVADPVITLMANNLGSNITQTANGGVVTSRLALYATGGSIDVTAGAANNNVAKIGGQAFGTFAYADSNSTGLLITSIFGGTPGILAVGGITVSVTKSGATLGVAALTSSNDSVTLQSDGDLTVGAGVIANGTGVITLTSNTGAVTEVSGGGLTGAKLAASAGTNVNLGLSSNTIGDASTPGSFAANAGGYVVLNNAGSIAIDQVGSVNGVTAGTDAVITTFGLSTNITQTTNATITTGGGLVLQALNGSILLDQANNVSGNFAVAGTSSSNVTLRNIGDLNIGLVTPAVGGTYPGIFISGTLSLISDTGSITQSGRIWAGTVQGSTGTGGNMTLDNADNQFGAVGPITLGAGTLSLVDSTGGLTVTGAVAAGGGVSLQTPGALAINNTLNGGTGDVSLTTTDAGAAITQNATGVITGGTLALSTNGGNATLDTATNAVTGLGPVTLGAGALRLKDSVTTLTVSGAVEADGGVAISNTGAIITTVAGTITTDNTGIALTAGTDVTIGGTVTSNGGAIALATGANGALAINAQVDAGAGNIFLAADTAITITESVSTIGAISIGPVTAGTAMTIGDSIAPVGLVIDNNSLGQLAGTATLNIGLDNSSATTAGLINVGYTPSVNNTVLNLFTTGGVSMSADSVNGLLFALVVNSGAGTLNVTAGGNVDLSKGVSVANVGGSSTGGYFSVQDGNGDLRVTGITTQNRDIVVTNPYGAVTIAGNLISNGGNIFVGAGGLVGGVFVAGPVTLAANLNAGSGSIGLFSTGSIDQNSGGLIGANLLAIICGGCGAGNNDMTLDSATNAITEVGGTGGNVTLVNLSNGNIRFTNSSGYTVGGISSISFIGGSISHNTAAYGPSSGPGIRTSGTGAVTLTAGGNIVQSLVPGDIVSTNTLVVGSLPGFNPNVRLNNDNAIANLGAVTLGTGTFKLVASGDLTITEASTTGGYDVTAGSITQAAGANINTSGVTNGVISLDACGCGTANLTLNANLITGANGRVNLTAGNDITQPGGAITTRTLNIQADNATLDSATNNFAIINAFIGANLSATTSRSLSIGSNGAASNGGSITLTALGATSDITVGNSTSIGDPFGNTTDITLNAGRDILSTGAVFGSGTVSLNGGRDVRVNFNNVGGVAGSDVTLNGARDVLVDGNVNASQTVSLLAGRDVTDTSNGRILTSNLRAVATTGAVNLSNSVNHATDTLAGSANGAFSYRQDGNLTIGSVGGTPGFASTNGGVTVDAGTGGITIDTLARVIANSEIVLAGSTFKNNRGSDAVASSAGRWLIYSTAPGTAADYNGLDSGNTAIWGTTYPAPVAASGNRYVFAMVPTVTLSPNNASKVYGDAVTMTYSATGLQPGVTGAYLADTIASATTGTPAATSAGLAGNAPVAGGPYTISVAQGTLQGANGYIALVNGTALLTVTPATLTYLADAASRVAGTPNPAFTGMVTGFKNGETLGTATTGSLAWSTPAGVSSVAGIYAINGSGLDAANYVFVQAAGNATALTVNQADAGPGPSQFNSPPVPNSGPKDVNFSFQPQGAGGPIPISFTPAAPLVRTGNTPSADVAPAALPSGQSLSTNNGLTYPPISQFDPNQYSQFKVADWAGQAGLAAIYVMLARGADQQHAADAFIDGFWNGTSSAWAPPQSFAGKVTFSDGAGNNVVPTGNAGFSVIAGTTDFGQLLKNGPVMISDGATPAHWLLATQLTPDGKGIVANDPASGKQVVLNYDAATKTVGGVTSVFDANSNKFVPFAEASTGTPALAGLQGFTPANFLAVSPK